MTKLDANAILQEKPPGALLKVFDKGLEAAENDSGAALLGRVHHFLGRFIAYPSKEAHTAHALWIAHTHAIRAVDSTPRLAFLSPEPASGKTRALEISELLVPNPVEAINVSPAYLFRKVGEGEGDELPTILFDEIDTVFGPKAKENEELRGLLNAGHRRGAVAGRCVVRGKDIQTEEIPAFCPVALAGLGTIPDTILTRAIVIRMRKRAPDENVEPYRRRLYVEEGEKLREELAEWAQIAIGKVIDRWPEMPPEIKDRDADKWEALIVVADAAGGDWPARARRAALFLVTESMETTPSLGVRLLSDIQTVFDGHAMPTVELLRELNGLTEAPWSDLKGKPITDRWLASTLSNYGVRPRDIRWGGKVLRGYTRADLHDAWARYVRPSPQKSATAATVLQPPSLLAPGVAGRGRV